MRAEVVLLPSHLDRATPLPARACVVFDVLRATTTMAAALAAGVREIRLFDSVEAARAAAAASSPESRLLCGETGCLPPPGFDLGNSPGQFRETHRGATVFMSTTNGTRALLAARSAAALFTGALVNAAAVAAAVRATGRDVTLLCAGTNAAIAMEDVLGAGAVIAALAAEPADDAGRIALRLFEAARGDLHAVLRDAAGGRNVRAAGLAEDLDFAARLDALPVVGVASGDPLVVRPLHPPDSQPPARG